MRDKTKKFRYAASNGSRDLGDFLKKIKEDKKGEEKSSTVEFIGQLTLDKFKQLKEKIKE